MKIPLAIIMFLFFCVSYTEAQIRISSNVVIEPEIIVAKYDSTANFLGDNPFGYIGQQLYLRGNNNKSYSLQSFLIDYTKSSASWSNRYAKHEWQLAYVYEALAGKYFDVLDVIEVVDNRSEKTFYLKLLETESRDTLYYKYSERFENSFPFVVVGYFKKRQHEVIAEQYVLSLKHKSRPSLPIKIHLFEDFALFMLGT